MAMFIVLEGIDGSGKSSVVRSLKKFHPNYYFTQEPSDSEAGKLAKKAANRQHSPYLDLFLYLADRVEHTDNIKEILNNHKTVICDRYWGSTSAYQSASDEISLEYTESIQMPFILEPDLTILFDIDPETALERISNRDIKSKYEKMEFLKKVRENYLKLANKHNWPIIDAGQSPNEVLSQVKELIDQNVKDVD
ncbi:MAG: dTMP kinase [Candidatus Saliniplasma sp.]